MSFFLALWTKIRTQVVSIAQWTWKRMCAIGAWSVHVFRDIQTYLATHRLQRIIMAVLLIFTTLFSVTEVILHHDTPSLTTKNQAPPATVVLNPASGNPGVGLPSQKGSGSTFESNVVGPAPNFVPSMTPLTIPLTPGQTAHGTSSDGLVDVTIPTDALNGTFALSEGESVHAANASVQLGTKPAKVVVTQVAPPSGSTNGGLMSFGVYFLQVQDSNGNEVLLSTPLRGKIAFTYHWPKQHLPVSAKSVIAVINGGTLPNPLRSSEHLGPQQVVVPTYDAKAKTSTIGITLGGSSASHLFSSGGSGSSGSSVNLLANAPDAYFHKADSWHADLQSGGISQQIPIDVPAGSGGLTPPISLSYSSSSVNENHSLQATSSWTGEGWSLDLGEITWSETNYLACKNCTGIQFESTWQLSDPFGTSSELIPPATNINTYYDNASNVPTSTPLIWHTANESHAKIISYTNPVANPNFPSSSYASQPPCFRVWLQNGIMEEFGCTPDSIQFYPAGSGTTINYVSAWKLDLITDPDGNQIHITYQQDWVTAPHYPRDAVPATITWDAPACHNAQNMCMGASWNPRMRVRFASSNTVAHPNGNTCAPHSDGTRCDDPQAGGSFAAPQVESTSVLNDITVEVNPSGDGTTWQQLHSYQLQYSQTSQSSGVDPTSGQTVGVAGEMLLKQFQEEGTDSSLKYPAEIFGYANEAQHYLNIFYTAAQCGPSWNTGCYSNNQTNHSYIVSVDTGTGVHTDFAWVEGHNNSHGVPSTTTLLDPTACNGQMSVSPCQLADEEAWSHIILTSQTVSSKDVTGTPLASTTTYFYRLTSLTSQFCTDCTVGMYWGDENDADWLDYYNTIFKGFNIVQENRSDGQQVNHYYYTTEGIGVFDTKYITSTYPCMNGYRNGAGYVTGTPVPCSNSAPWDLWNAASGREYQTDLIDAHGNLAGRTVTQYTVLSPPPTVSASPAVTALGTGNWDGHLVAELDPWNPVTAIDVQTASVATYTTNSSMSPPSAQAISNVPTTTTNYTYDNTHPYGLVTKEVDSTNGGAPGEIIHDTAYVWNDSIAIPGSGTPTGTYLVLVAGTDETLWDGSGRTNCKATGYDWQAWGTGQNANITLGHATQNYNFTTCGTATSASWGSGGQLTTFTNFNGNGDAIGIVDADANSGIGGHTGNGANGSCSGLSTCTSYDSTYWTVPIATGNALYQSGIIGMGQTAAGGWGLWPLTATDANGQTTATTYDTLGRTTSVTKPGETAGQATSQTSYTVWCPQRGTSLPCLEVDTTNRIDASNVVTSRVFYNGFGDAVETRTPGPSGQDVIQWVQYDALGRRVAQSQPYFVTAYTGAPGSAAFSAPDTSKPKTVTQYDSLDHVIATTDPAGATTTTSVGILCNVPNFSDGGCYTQNLIVDGNGHQTDTLVDDFGQTIYTQQYTGSSKGTYAVYATTVTRYDVAGRVIQVQQPTVGTTVTTYDDAGRAIQAQDPDLGTVTSTYDLNGNLLSTVDGRGATGTVWSGYDGLNRKIWTSSQSTGSNPLATWSYDNTANGNQGKGRLTSETFASGPNQTVTGSYAYGFDARGQQTSWTMTISGASYTVGMAYNDAGQVTTLTYPSGEQVQNSYNSADWMGGVNLAQGGTTTTLLGSAQYTGLAGASHNLTGIQVGNAATSWAFGYDAANRLSDTTISKAGATLFDQSRTFDAIGNVTTISTTLPAGTDHQVFCYDEQDRLTWAGSSGTPACGSLSAGTLTSAAYSQTYSYDADSRLRSGPQGTYWYGSTPAHAVVSTSNGYGAGYDAAGDMICRQQQNWGTACAGAADAQILSYDALRQLIQWQDWPVSPSMTTTYVYNGEGERVQQSSSQFVYGGAGATTTSTTLYIGGYADIATANGTTTTTTYYQAGPVTATNVNGQIHYLANDDLGSVSVALSTSGTVTATQLYTPYGSVRASNGAMPTSYGFTKMRQDPSGLYYDHARYYDPAVGQFITADIVQGPNRYLYVGGNPETQTDPTGNCPWCITALIGAVVGAGIAYGSQVISNVQQHGLSVSALKPTDGGAILKAAIGGAIIGAGGAALEGMFAAVTAGMSLSGEGALAVSLAGKTAIGAVTGAGGQILDNAMNGRNALDGVGQAALWGAGTGLVTGTITDGLKLRIPNGATRAGSTAVKTNPLLNVQYTFKVMNQYVEPGEFHSFPNIVDNYGADGIQTPLVGNDGVTRTLLEIEGGYNNRSGVFQYIIEPDGAVNHRFFKTYSR